MLDESAIEPWGRRADDLPSLPLELDAELGAALATDDLQLVFQPQVRMADGRIVGVEALARWRHPRLGELGAETLFAVAARSRLTTALSHHLQEKASCAAAIWPAALSSLRLSLNVTAPDLLLTDFAARFLRTVRACGFPCERLTAEIVESELITDLPAAARALTALRDEGVCIALDDFGTGYASLAYLAALPLDSLKIDQGLAAGITEPRDRVVVEGVIAIARGLGLQVVAEGVETEEQRALLADAGVDIWQGFLCAPPLNEAALAALITERASPAHG